MSRALVATGTLVTAMLVTVWLAAGGSGLLYALLYIVAVAPGVPLGIAVFGRRHAAAWIGGALVGYGTTQLGIWAAIVAGTTSPLGLIVWWMAQAALLIACARWIASPALTLAEWRERDTAALAAALLLVPMLMAPPYMNIGAKDEQGTKYYRAYFTADFLWHTALAAELGKHAMPPRNPYLAPQTMHYYWTYFLLPAITAHDAPAPLNDIERDLKTNAICTAVLVVGALFVLVRAAVPVAWPALTAVLLGAVAASAEGAWTIVRLLQTQSPLSSVTGLNIDAITNWKFGGLRIDCLPRALWYNPQHSLSCALGLMSLVVASSGAIGRLPAIAFAGLCLGLAVCMNPFVGAVFSIIYGLAILWDARARRREMRTVFVHALAAAPVGGALVWCAFNEITSGAGTSLRLGLHGLAAQAPLITLMLSVGPVFVPAMIGFWPIRNGATQTLRIGAIGTALSVGLMYFVIVGDDAWVGFRAGQILLLMLPVLLARAMWILGGMRGGRALTAAIVVAVLAVGLPTTVIDEYNAQDIHNTGMGAGFRWTVTLSAAEQEALHWIRDRTPENAVVQMEPVVRDRDQWTLIPAFAQRRMAAGLPISLLALPEYTDRSNDVKRMFQTSDAGEASAIARRWRIAYIYVDRQDRKTYPEGTRKFDLTPALFGRVFANAEVEVFRLSAAPVSQKSP